MQSIGGGGGEKERDAGGVPKTGGGREAFKSNESRMPGENDDDYDGVDVRRRGNWKPRLRWNRFKWILFLTNVVVRFRSPSLFLLNVL